MNRETILPSNMVVLVLFVVFHSKGVIVAIIVVEVKSIGVELESKYVMCTVTKVLSVSPKREVESLLLVVSVMSFIVFVSLDVDKPIDIVVIASFSEDEVSSAKFVFTVKLLIVLKVLTVGVDRLLVSVSASVDTAEVVVSIVDSLVELVSVVKYEVSKVVLVDSSVVCATDVDVVS